MAGLKSKAVLTQLAPTREALVRAVTQAVRDQVAALRAMRVDFYGYAVVCDELAEMIAAGSVSGAYNCEEDLKGDQATSAYYRYSVDEWAHWPRDGEGASAFEKVASCLLELNRQFRELHPDDKADDDFDLDGVEIAHGRSVLEAVLQGLNAAKDADVFGHPAPFLVVWISDSSETIGLDSVRRLNAPRVVKEFMAEFG